MRLLSMFALLAAVNLTMTAPPANAQVSGEPKLHQVQKIYVGEMGETDEADRLRLLLEEQIAKNGFVVVDTPEKADAILTGALSVRTQQRNSTARVYVRLHTTAGQRIWGRDFGSRLTGLFSLTEPVKLRARDVADGLKEDWAKSAKLHGATRDR